MNEPSSAVAIVPLLASDFVQVRTIEHAGQQEPWSDDALLGELVNEHGIHFGIRSLDDGVLAAFMLARLVLDELHIHALCIHPCYRRRGYARALLLHALAAARSRRATRALLEVAASNIAALQLYEKAGFAVDARRKGYYASGDDALLMSRAIG